MMLLLLMLPSASMAVWWSPVINSTLARAGQDFDILAMEGFTRSVELFEQMEAALQSIVGPDAQDRGFGLVSANTVYNNLASSSTVLKVIIINICQLFFNSVGWYLVSWIWSILRQVVVPQYPIWPSILFQTNPRTGSVSWDPDFQGAFTSQALLNSEFAATNLTGAAGSVRKKIKYSPVNPFSRSFQVFFSFMLWTAILTIFGAGTVSGIGKRSMEDWETSSYLYEEERYEEDLKTWQKDMRRWEQEERKRKDEIVNNWFSNLFSSFTSSSSSGEARLGVSFTDASFLAVLDDTFTFASTTKQFVLNSMGVGFNNE